MASDAARAMWPYLATKDVQPTGRQSDAKPEWGQKPGPVLVEPPPVIRDYSKVPGLIPKVKR
jgi:hypothetical protein